MANKLNQIIALTLFLFTINTDCQIINLDSYYIEPKFTNCLNPAYNTDLRDVIKI